MDVDDDDGDRPLFVSLGLLILDHLHLPDGTVRRDVLGGSGTFSTFGARLAVDGEQSQRIASLVLAGEDFPRQKVEEHLRPWGVDYEIRVVDGVMSSRGRLEYHDWKFARKSYEYLTAPLQHRPADLPSRFLRSSAFHVLASPDLLSTQIAELADCRAKQQQGCFDPALLVWEPAPLSCVAHFLDAYVEAVRLVDVFSPNHVELLALCDQSARDFDKGLVEDRAATFMGEGHLKPEVCIVRCGEHGAVVLEREGMQSTWIPPCFSLEEVERIVDATGARNTFLGAFTVAYQQNGRHAVRAASFALEQVGLPILKEGKWNGETMAERMGRYSKKIGRRSW